MSGLGVDGLALLRNLRWRKLAGGSSRVNSDLNVVIDIPDDGNIEKAVSEENVLRSELNVMLESLEFVEVGGEQGCIKEVFYLLHFRHVEFSTIGSDEVGVPVM